jgi:trk system potassium uptake protein TrkH
MINYKPVIRVLGFLSVIIGLLMLTGLPFSIYFESGDAVPLLVSAFTAMLLGLPLLIATRQGEKDIRKREGYLIVALGWLTMVTISMLPYLFSGVLSSVTDAFFETMSGMTTTGASVLNRHRSHAQRHSLLAQPDPMDRRDGYYRPNSRYFPFTGHWRY